MASFALAALGSYTDSEDDHNSDNDEHSGAVAQIPPPKRYPAFLVPAVAAPQEDARAPSPDPGSRAQPVPPPEKSNASGTPDSEKSYDGGSPMITDVSEEAVNLDAEIEVIPSPGHSDEAEQPKVNEADKVRRLMLESDVELPPEPQGECPPQLQEKITRYLLEMETKKKDMNQVIQANKKFRNPSIYEKLIQFCSIDEFGTNYPPEIYNPLKWDKSSYYDELAKVQMAVMDKKLKARAEKMQGVVFDKQYKKPAQSSGTTSSTSSNTGSSLPRRTTVF